MDSWEITAMGFAAAQYNWALAICQFEAPNGVRMSRLGYAAANSRDSFIADRVEWLLGRDELVYVFRG